MWYTVYMKDIDIENRKYAISDDGKVWSYRKNRFVKGYITKKGYLAIDTGKKVLPVHRLVAEAFVPNPYNKPQVNHKDSNKLNNHFHNLEWCTPKENITHAIRAGMHQSVKNRKLSPEQVREIRSKYAVKENGYINLSREYGVSPMAIRDLVKYRSYAEVR